jgi:hypothetical protein
VQAPSTAVADRHGLHDSNPAPGNSIELRVIMLRLALSRLTFHSNHHRLFSNCRVSLMESESAGTHKDPVSGEVISKQFVYFPPNVVPLFIDPPCAGNLSVAKSNVIKRQEGRRILRIGLRPRIKTTPQRWLQTRKIFRLMYVGRIDICDRPWADVLLCTRC